jgi:hypothetical protein
MSWYFTDTVGFRVDGESDLDSGVLRDERREPFKDDDSHVVVGARDRHGSNKPLVAPSKTALERSHLVFDAFRARQHLLPGLSQRVAGGVTVEQPRRQSCLEGTHPACDRRVAHTQRCSRGTYGASARQREKMSNVIPVHRRVLRRAGCLATAQTDPLCDMAPTGYAA